MVTCGLKIASMDWETAPALLTYAEVDNDKPNNRFNDGKADPVGRMLAGTYSLAVSPQNKLHTLPHPCSFTHFLKPINHAFFCLFYEYMSLVFQQAQWRSN